MTNKHIYLAGGCFWGTEHFFKQIAGVVETEVGFANGQTVNPTYEQVYTDTTGYAETELMFQDYEHYPEQWYCEGCMGESTFDKIKAYAELSEERREAYEAYLSYWDEGTLEDFEAISRTSPRGCNAALIIRQYGATSIRQAITRRSMGISSGIERSGATRFSFELRPADPAAGLFSTPENVVLLHCLRQKDAG